MDVLRKFIRENLEMIQKTPLEVLNILKHAVARMSIFAKVEENKKFRRMWLDLFDVIDSERKGILKDEEDRELAKTTKKMAKLNLEGSTDDDIEAGAPEYRPPSGNANTKPPVLKPFNRKKENERNQINGAKTKKKK